MKNDMVVNITVINVLVNQPAPAPAPTSLWRGFFGFLLELIVWGGLGNLVALMLS